MARSGMLVKVASVVVLMWMVVSTVLPHHHAQVVIRCRTATTSILPCLEYLKSGGTVPAACCVGINNLYKAAKTTTDCQTVCSCLKTAAASVPGINYDNANSLPAKCGVSLPFKISPSTDCSKVTCGN